MTRHVRVSLVPDLASVSAGGATLHTPGLTEPDVFGVAVDVLRATSTLSVAFAAGASRVLPFARTAAAIAWRDAHSDALACGERDGAMVPGFDLGKALQSRPEWSKQYHHAMLFYELM